MGRAILNIECLWKGYTWKIMVEVEKKNMPGDLK